MRTITDGRTLDSLVSRLLLLREDTPRRWGTLTAGEMLCHLGDTVESVLGKRVAPGPPPSRVTRPFLKWLILYAPLPHPRGAKTRPGVNPKIDGTRPRDFERDRDRVIVGLRSLAAAAPGALAAHHFMFGPMSPRDWHRWAYRHVNHHLRQFNL